MTAPKWTPEEAARFAERYRGGETLKKLAPEAGLSVPGLRHRFDALGVERLPNRGNSRPISAERREKILSLLRAGHFACDVAKAAGLAAERVREIARAAGIDLMRRPKDTWLPADARKALKAYAETRSVDAAARAAGCSWHKARLLLKKRGLLPDKAGQGRPAWLSSGVFDRFDEGDDTK